MGFEPTLGYEPTNGLANRPLRPLEYPSTVNLHGTIVSSHPASRQCHSVRKSKNWRRGQDSNLQAFLGRRFSRPLRYQLRYPSNTSIIVTGIDEKAKRQFLPILLNQFASARQDRAAEPAEWQCCHRAVESSPRVRQTSGQWPAHSH